MFAARSGSTEAAYERRAYPGMRRKPTDRIGGSIAMTQIVHSMPHYGKCAGARLLRWGPHALFPAEPRLPGVRRPSRVDARVARSRAEAFVRRDRHRRRGSRARDGVLPREEP